MMRKHCKKVKGPHCDGSYMIESLLGFVAIFALALLRVPLAFAMGIVGVVGMGLTRGWVPALASTAQVVHETGFAYTLSVIPLFILMGNFVARAGLAHELFAAAYAFIGHFRGGLAHATVAACAGFGAICGSSIATAATMSKVAYPSMKKMGYSDSLSTGVMAAGGTLGIMIPPSTIMVIYGIITETNIGKLFAAGVIPGILTALLLMASIAVITARDPEHAPRGERTSWPDRWKALRGIWGVILLVIVVLGGIYGGIFTATEGAGFGAAGAFLFALARRRLTWAILYQVLVESARTTAMLFTLLIAATIFANFVNFTSMPGDLKEWITHLGLSPIMIISAMMLIYVVLGTVMEELTMVLLTIPLFFPIVTTLGFDPVWFGVLIVMIVQIGLISPPVGMNLFVLNALLPGVGLAAIFRGCWPFVLVMIFVLCLLIAFPQLSLWLPSLMQ
jgi:C4-dicarboxylate transporter, DctM subunit